MFDKKTSRRKFMLYSAAATGLLGTGISNNLFAKNKKSAEETITITAILAPDNPLV